jgi:hypothetical protein
MSAFCNVMGFGSRCPQVNDLLANWGDGPIRDPGESLVQPFDVRCGMMMMMMMMMVMMVVMMMMMMIMMMMMMMLMMMMLMMMMMMMMMMLMMLMMLMLVMVVLSLELVMLPLVTRLQGVAESSNDETDLMPTGSRWRGGWGGGV